ncbi:TPA: hypothetical protein DDY56_04130 [Candidatus Uhrbacteria bacterium]|uniref:Uncharacterized protein n=1 Tax=Candidatus Uhrbacteria bacterium GW2011_GWC1_41_20 TaxID=1618983 RepID=A0A0G0YF51_9BACT|nr:MAG: hypothetical protein UT52_C0018G0024 [Candidatus Uhrbacteria bacterium GW2011_GWE1_39_46]KKR63299.1 MAG: hypothetical protein UU04_C0021G0022 [Candidatus Uhrbacteria bacterium GW2011_GWC2_40_450]KKR98967.1 MAG: hypothetical protein UU50_C0012G0015 [Candidatus Uhrbacteria bacterium GW2011_GWC1_41_20]KKS07243.1 MAG: hypothetical protein UU62_C0020G0046 [Candidatus Uhrbacteria bacterium GW2011_GWF2_41_40]KKS17091.1 MAG: hypothetical protein UU75_C0024G0014 [Candidatus Uhrbacteria bacterium
MRFKITKIQFALVMAMRTASVMIRANGLLPGSLARALARYYFGDHAKVDRVLDGIEEWDASVVFFLESRDMYRFRREPRACEVNLSQDFADPKTLSNAALANIIKMSTNIDVDAMQGAETAQKTGSNKKIGRPKKVIKKGSLESLIGPMYGNKIRRCEILATLADIQQMDGHIDHESAMNVCRKAEPTMQRHLFILQKMAKQEWLEKIPGPYWKLTLKGQQIASAFVRTK